MPELESLPKTDDEGKVIDYLEEDAEIPTQRFAILSFISPEKVIKQRAEYFNEQFIQWLEYDWKAKGMEHFVAFLSKKYTLKVDDLFKDLEEFKKVHNEEISKTDVKEQYQVFLLQKEKELDVQFSELVKFQTNVRGVKVRRVFQSLEECQTYAKVLQRRCPNDNIFIGKVGMWLPWDPSEHMMPEVEYAEQELNEMMRRYKEGEVNRDIFFEEEKRERIDKHKKEQEEIKRKNIENAKKDAGVADIKDLDSSFQQSIHPSEGGVRDL
jgi:hypothetical protein